MSICDVCGKPSGGIGAPFGHDCPGRPIPLIRNRRPARALSDEQESSIRRQERLRISYFIKRQARKYEQNADLYPYLMELIDRLRGNRGLDE